MFLTSACLLLENCIDSLATNEDPDYLLFPPRSRSKLYSLYTIPWTPAVPPNRPAAPRCRWLEWRRTLRRRPWRPCARRTSPVVEGLTWLKMTLNYCVLQIWIKYKVQWMHRTHLESIMPMPTPSVLAWQVIINVMSSGMGTVTKLLQLLMILDL